MENRDIWQRYMNSKSPELKEQLVLQYLPLVKKVAYKLAGYLPAHISRDDLNSNGIFGLIEAVERYNVELGIPFSVYASKRIKGAIIDAMRKEDWIPLSLRKKAKLVEEAYCTLENKLYRSATDEEVAEYLQISLEELNIWLKEIRFISIISIDQSLIEGEITLYGEYLGDKYSPDPEIISENNELKTILAKAVNELPHKEKSVVSLYYYNDLSNKEIAQIMDLSDSRISQLHTKAIFRLRGKLSRQKRNL